MAIENVWYVHSSLEQILFESVKYERMLRKTKKIGCSECQYLFSAFCQYCLYSKCSTEDCSKVQFNTANEQLISVRHKCDLWNFIGKSLRLYVPAYLRSSSSLSCVRCENSQEYYQCCSITYLHSLAHILTAIEWNGPDKSNRFASAKSTKSNFPENGLFHYYSCGFIDKIVPNLKSQIHSLH